MGELLNEKVEKVTIAAEHNGQMRLFVEYLEKCNALMMTVKYAPGSTLRALAAHLTASKKKDSLEMQKYNQFVNETLVLQTIFAKICQRKLLELKKCMFPVKPKRKE